MSGLPLPAVIPPVTLHDRTDSPHGLRRPGLAKRPPLPLSRLPMTRQASTVYGLATLDTHGRIADRAVMTALGWAPGARLAIAENNGLIVVSAAAHGVFRLTAQSHLLLPATVRQWCALTTGDRVLLAAELDAGMLVVHPPVALDAMTAPIHAAVLGGGLG
jgi:hypothetical protein